MSANPDDVFADLAERKDFAKAANKSERTVVRWCDEPDGLPHLKLGNRTYVHLPTAREWLLNRLQNPNPRRRRTA